MLKNAPIKKNISITKIVFKSKQKTLGILEKGGNLIGQKLNLPIQIQGKIVIDPYAISHSEGILHVLTNDVLNDKIYSYIYQFA